MADKISNKFERVPNQVLDDYLTKVYNQNIMPTDLHKDLYDHVFKNNRRMAESGYGKRFTDATDVKEFALMQKMEKNIAQFTGGKLNAYTDELRRSMYRDGKKLSFEEWSAKAKTVSRKHLVTWRKTEERTMAQAASSAGHWAEIERRAYLYPFLKYVTAHDELVRDSHRLLDGAIYKVSDPFWNTHYPPNGWNCRCIVIQTDKGAKAGNGDIKIGKGMSNNAGKTGLLVTEDHPYFNMNDLDKEKVYKQVETLHFSNTKDNALRATKASTVVGQLPDGRGELSLLKHKDIKHILSTNHQNRPARNNLLLNLESLLSESQFIKSTVDDGTHSTWARYWHYYKLVINDIDYYLNIYERIDGSYGLFSITESIKK